MIATRLRLALVIACLALHPAQLVSAQSAIDPQSLVGEWSGKWIAAATGGGNGGRAGLQGPYVLTITKVEGTRVLATIETRGFSGDIRGTLEDNRLIFAGQQFRTELTVDGKEMRGQRQGGGIPAREIELVKK